MSADEHKPPSELRPPDPAGSRPRHDPDSVLPSGEGPLLRSASVAGAVLPAAPFAAAGAAGPAAAEPAAPLAPAAPPPHAARFQFLLGALLAVGAAAVVLFLAALLHDDTPSGPSGPTWSAWHPVKGSENSAAQQIAAHIAPRYRLDGGQQAVLVDGGPLTVADLPLTVAIRAPASLGGGVKLFENKKSLLYRFCGLGDKCSVTPGKPSAERHLLLRREALELALYSFRYTDADQVVVFMPPRGKSTKGGQALFFQRRMLSPELEQPVDSTLTDDVPRPSSIVHSADRLLVDQQTIPALFNFTLQQANQDNAAFLVLDPLQVSKLQQPAPAAKKPSTHTKST